MRRSSPTSSVPKQKGEHCIVDTISESRNGSFIWFERMHLSAFVFANECSYFSHTGMLRISDVSLFQGGVATLGVFSDWGDSSAFVSLPVAGPPRNLKALQTIAEPGIADW